MSQLLCEGLGITETQSHNCTVNH